VLSSSCGARVSAIRPNAAMLNAAQEPQRAPASGRPPRPVGRFASTMSSLLQTYAILASRNTAMVKHQHCTLPRTMNQMQPIRQWRVSPALTICFLHAGLDSSTRLESSSRVSGAAQQRASSPSMSPSSSAAERPLSPSGKPSCSTSIIMPLQSPSRECLMPSPGRALVYMVDDEHETWY
jgi:hypothetical protein